MSFNEDKLLIDYYHACETLVRLRTRVDMLRSMIELCENRLSQLENHAEEYDNNEN